jgi:hypothetical protein
MRDAVVHTDGSVELSDGSRLPAVPNSAATRAFNKDVREGDILRPWMMAYAEWCNELNERYTNAEHKRKIRELSGFPCGRDILMWLRGRADFQKYQRALQRGGIEKARLKMERDLPRYVEMHKEAAEAVLATEPEKVAAFTNRMLDRAWPIKQDAQVAATQVTITMAPGALSAPAAVIETEAVELPPAPADIEPA